MPVSRYHKILRVSAVVVTLLLLFDGGFLTPVSKQLSDNTINYLAAGVTSVVATVEPNDINAITGALSARERELDAREAMLNARTIENRNFTTETASDYSTYILSLILFVLTVLIIMNYVLDWLRIRRINFTEQTS